MKNLTTFRVANLSLKKEADIAIVKVVFQNCWCVDTAAMSYKERCKEFAMAGQCLPTSLIIQDYFGGIIKEGKLDHATHFFNEIDGVIYDFTKEQFADNPKYIDEHGHLRFLEPPIEITRNSVLYGDLNALNLQRYLLLRQLFDDYLHLHY